MGGDIHPPRTGVGLIWDYGFPFYTWIYSFAFLTKTFHKPLRRSEQMPLPGHQ